MRLYKDQTGFSHIVALLLIVVLSAVSLVGYRVYSSNKEIQAPASQAPAQPPKPDAAKEVKIPDNFKLYENNELGIKFAYPKEWLEVPLEADGIKAGGKLSLVSPAQRKAHDDFAKSNRQTEGPAGFDLYLSKWDSINDQNAKGGSYLGEPESYQNLEEYLTNNNSSKKKVGEFNIGSQKVFEVSIGGLRESYGIMFERPDKSVYEFNFINIWDKSKVDEVTKTIINTIELN